MNKYVQPVTSIFKNLPKTLKWRSFLMNDLNLLTDIPLIIRKDSEKHDLNKIILMLTYAKLLETCGWRITHLQDCPLLFHIRMNNNGLKNLMMISNFPLGLLCKTARTTNLCRKKNSPSIAVFLSELLLINTI